MSQVIESGVQVLIAGGGLGGIAAALAATAMGARVLLVEETGCLGGQVTSQGVSALDEHKYIESCGGTASYMEFRKGIRNYYREHYRLSDVGTAAEYLNPGSADPGRRFAFEPAVGAAVIEEMLRPARDAGLLDVALNTRVVRVGRRGGRISSVSVLTNGRREGMGLAWPSGRRDLPVKSLVDATELGEVLPLAGAEYRTGVESHAETGEPSAPEEAQTNALQPITYTMAVEFREGESHVIAKPPLYDELRATHPFTLNGFRMFEPGTFGRSFWEYRRILDARNFADERVTRDVSLINWLSTDYHEESIVGLPERALHRHLHRAKQLTLCFLYWLQTEAPRDGGGQGYPELMLRGDVLGSRDGLSLSPYIRESRRLLAVHTIREQDITSAFNPGSRARLMPDACGLGFYYRIDIHRCCHTKLRSGSGEMLAPFQIPTGALLSPRVSNLIAGGKTIGTTHITNGACRYHPVEWSTGEAAGMLAAMAAIKGVQPLEVQQQRLLMQRYQLALLRNGAPLFWFDDLPQSHPAFVAASFLAVQGIVDASPSHLHFFPDRPVSEATASAWVERARRRYRLRRQVAADLRGNFAGATRAECAVALLTALPSTTPAASRGQA